MNGQEGTNGSVDQFEDTARIIRGQFDAFFGALGMLIRAVGQAGPEATADLRDAIIIMAGEAFDQVAQSGPPS